MLVCKLGLITNNNILDNSDRGIAWLLGDLDGFLLGQTDGFPVGTSVGVSVGILGIHRLILQLMGI